MVAVVFLLSSCATAPVANPTAEAEAYKAIAECYRTQATKETAELNKMVTSTDVQLLAAINALKVAVNKDYNPCAGITTNAELQKVAMQENTKRLDSGLGFGKSVLTTALWAYLGGKAIDAVADMSGGDSYTITDSTVSDSLNKYNVNGGDLSFATAEPYIVEPAIAETP
jgi:hypothetical protein